MNENHYTPKGPSRQEATPRTNRIRSSTAPAFATREHGEWKPGGNSTGYFSCQVLGYEVKMRFGYMWTAYCPEFDIETAFTHRPDDAKVTFLTDWLTAHIECPQTIEARLRQETPLADEIIGGH